MPPSYEKPCATRPHRSPPWIWRGTHWELAGSGAQDCICAQYAVYKLSGVVPGTEPVEEVSADPGDPTIIPWLEKNGFTAHQTIPCSGGAPDVCGCGLTQMSRCAVVYKSVPDGAVAHIAVFDPEFCDWGGKLSARGPIARFANPGDYCTIFSGTGAGEMEMLFYCSETPGTYVSDEDIDRGLRQLSVDPTQPEPVPDDFGLFPTLRKFFSHWLSWLLILGVVVLIYALS